MKSLPVQFCIVLKICIRRQQELPGAESTSVVCTCVCPHIHMHKAALNGLSIYTHTY